jgi:hypothetical protein
LVYFLVYVSSSPKSTHNYYIVLTLFFPFRLIFVSFKHYLSLLMVVIWSTNACTILHTHCDNNLKI